MKTIGKLLWHKAIRDQATCRSGGVGEVIIKVPFTFQVDQHPESLLYNYKNIQSRIIKAVADRFKKSPNVPILLLKEKDSAFAGVSLVWDSETEGEATITLATRHLEVWQWLCNQKYAAVGTKTTYYGKTFP